MSRRNVTAESSQPSGLPRLRPLPRWGSAGAFQLFPEQPPVSLTPTGTLPQATLKTDKGALERNSRQLHLLLGAGDPAVTGTGEEEATRRGRTQPSSGQLHLFVQNALPEIGFGPRHCAVPGTGGSEEIPIPLPYPIIAVTTGLSF